MVLSQQCVQSCLFDGKLINSQCSDFSVLCVCVSKQLYDEDSFFSPLIWGLGASRGSLVLKSRPKGHTASPPLTTWGVVDTISALILKIYL